MTSDLQGLLAAVAADPADDTARLVYADCLEEHGNSARAEFIRLQVGAERLHPDSNARAALERQAWALFSAHWIEWWTEVCAGTGLKLPVPKPSGRLGRLARRVGLTAEPGKPYTAMANNFWPTEPIVGPSITQLSFVSNERNRGFLHAVFRRGFPDALLVSSWRAEADEYLPATWARTGPLDALHGDDPDLGPDGPHLARVRSLIVRSPTTHALSARLRSPHLHRLEELAFEQTDEGAAEWSDVFSLPRVRQLKRLRVPFADASTAHALAGAVNLRELSALSLDLAEGADDVVAVLARSPHLAKLEALTLGSGGGTDLWRAARGALGWKGLRKLALGPYEDDLNPDVFPPEPLRALLGTTDLPALEELRLDSLTLNRETIDLFVRSPLMKQLKHFACGVYGLDGVAPADLYRLPQMFDLNRIETVAFGAGHTMPELDEFRRQLGDRLRF